MLYDNQQEKLWEFGKTDENIGREYNVIFICIGFFPKNERKICQIVISGPDCPMNDHPSGPGGGREMPGEGGCFPGIDIF